MFVNLEALYPSPNVLGTELCFEEMMARQRGWLNKVWKKEASSSSDSSVSPPDTAENTSTSSIDIVAREVSEKLTIARDPVMLDENGVTKEQNREGRGRRMKIKEVNETQISRSWSKFAY